MERGQTQTKESTAGKQPRMSVQREKTNFLSMVSLKLSIGKLCIPI